MSVFWKKKVYGGKDVPKRIGYRGNLDKFCKRFDYTCQACDRKYKKRLLSLHHIVPIDDGGSNNEYNLILVCKPCHNKIEENTRKFNSYSKIECVFKVDKRRRVTKKENGVNWQSWVYGGKRNPVNRDDLWLD